MKKIFVFDNNKDILEIVSYILVEEGYDILAFGNEERILERIENYSPDLILLDIVQVSEQGTLICRTLKANIKTMHIPVIVFSTHPKATMINKACADDVVPKPFDISGLINAVEMQLR